MKATTLVLIDDEAERAHTKHGQGSMRAEPVGSPWRVSIIVEELGEATRELNDARLEHRSPDWRKLHAELIQTAAMVADWADEIAALIH